MVEATMFNDTLRLRDFSLGILSCTTHCIGILEIQKRIHKMYLLALLLSDL